MLLRAGRAGCLEEVAPHWAEPCHFFVFHAQEPSEQPAVLGTAFLMLAVFVVLYVLVYVECLVRWWLWASTLLIWACLVTLGYVLVFDSWMKEACAWEQVTGRGPWHPCGLDALLGCTFSGHRVPVEAGPAFGVLAPGPARSCGRGSVT